MQALRRKYAVVYRDKLLDYAALFHKEKIEWWTLHQAIDWNDAFISNKWCAEQALERLAHLAGIKGRIVQFEIEVQEVLD